MSMVVVQSEADVTGDAEKICHIYYPSNKAELPFIPSISSISQGEMQPESIPQNSLSYLSISPEIALKNPSSSDFCIIRAYNRLKKEMNKFASLHNDYKTRQNAEQYIIKMGDTSPALTSTVIFDRNLNKSS